MDIHEAIKILQNHKSKSIQDTNIRTFAKVLKSCTITEAEIEAENYKDFEEFISALAIVANEAQKYIGIDRGMGNDIECFIKIALGSSQIHFSDPDKKLDSSIRDELLAFLKAHRPELF